MSIMGLDLSSKSTGWAKFTKDGKLMDKGRIVPAKDINPFFKIHYVVNQLKPLYNGIDTIIIEDLYYNKFGGSGLDNILYLARLSGAVACAWIDFKYSDPIWYTASHARKLAGINGHAQKAEVQCWVLAQYKWATKKQITEWQETIDTLKKDYKDNLIKKGKYKYQMEKLSKLIDKETGVGEDCADAIVLGRGYCNDKTNNR